MKEVLRTVAHAVARVLFGLYGAWSWWHGPRPRLPFAAEEIRRILVIRLDLMGDVVYSLPAIEALGAAFPEARIDLLALPYTAPILRRARSGGKIYELDVNAYRRLAGWRHVGGLLGTVGALRREGYDLVVGLQGLMGGVFAVLSGARWRVGYRDETYPGCYNIPVRDRRYRRSQHEVDYCLDLVRALRVEVPSSGFRVPKLTAVTSQPETRNPELATPYVVLVPGASNGSAKRWPAPYWSELADRLALERGLTVALTGTPAERTLADSVIQGMQAPVVDLVGRTSVDQLMELLAGAAVVVAGDTGPLHLAAALGRPVVGLYGPTDPAHSGPLGPSVSVLRLGLACSPCYDLRSPAECKLPDKSVACMWGLSVDRVFQAVGQAAGGPA